MMYDIERIEVLMHDVRMQSVDVPKGGGGGSEKWVQCSSAVKKVGFLLQMDVQCFNCFPS